MKIEFYNKETGKVESFQDDFYVNCFGDVFQLYIHDIYGYGEYFNKSVAWRVVE